MTNLEKGNRLEEAVRRIETSIIQSALGYSEARFEIESKKIISVQGVRHEIDVWVTARIAAGYQSFFIFECRNREEKVSKNDIIVFSEKVRAANTAKGFFVAKAFTQDALAQVALDPRMETLVAEELDASSINFREVPFRTDFREDEAYVGVFTDANPLRVFSMELPSPTVTSECRWESSLGDGRSNARKCSLRWSCLGASILTPSNRR